MAHEKIYQDPEIGTVTFRKSTRSSRVSIRVHPSKGVTVSVPKLSTTSSDVPAPPQAHNDRTIKSTSNIAICLLIFLAPLLCFTRFSKFYTGAFLWYQIFHLQSKVISDHFLHKNDNLEIIGGLSASTNFRAGEI